MGCWEGRGEVRFEGGGVERPANNLLDLAGVDIDAASEFGHCGVVVLWGRCVRVKCKGLDCLMEQNEELVRLSIVVGLCRLGEGVIEIDKAEQEV